MPRSSARMKTILGGRETGCADNPVGNEAKRKRGKKKDRKRRLRNMRILSADGSIKRQNGQLGKSAGIIIVGVSAHSLVPKLPFGNVAPGGHAFPNGSLGTRVKCE